MLNKILVFTQFVSFYCLCIFTYHQFWHCWLGIRKSIWPIKMSDEVLVWLSVWSEVEIVCIWSSQWHPKTP